MAAGAPEELHALVQAAINGGDIEALVELYDDDATLIVPPQGVRAVGKHAIREAVRATFALKPEAQMEVLSKVEADGLALTQGWWRLVGTAEDGGRVELSGRGAMVSRCRPDGTWKIVLDNPMTASATTSPPVEVPDAGPRGIT
jgi:uncharacterized protein (TIGR02246 family)